MLQYNFDKINERRNTHSLKWNVAEKELPMWVADMDFQTAPVVTDALIKRAQSGIFGYTIVPEEWYKAYQNWWDKRHHFMIKKEWLIFCTGVIPAITCAVKRMTNVGDNIVVQTPVYDIFFHSIENHGRHVLENKMHYDGERYEIDFKDLEEKLSNPLTTMMILCNPHNPVGKVWTKEELERIGTLCKKSHVFVVSDEIHCDLTAPDNTYVPFVAVSEDCARNSMTCIAPTKAFNMAGLQTAAVVISDEASREKMNRGLNSDEIAEPGSFAVDAVLAAFSHGEDWLEELKGYINDNKQLVAEYLKKEIPNLHMVEGNATYLLWIDCNKVTSNTEELCRFIRENTGLYVTAGGQYRGNGQQFLRMNIACPRAVVEDGLQRLKKGVSEYRKGLIEQVLA